MSDMQKKAQTFARTTFSYRNAIGWWLSITIIASIAYTLLAGYNAPFNMPIALTISAFALVGIDKAKAKTNRWRVPEKFFYFVAICFGSLGMLAGMHVFRHKTSKVSFQFVLAIVVLIQIALLAWYAADTGVL